MNITAAILSSDTGGRSKRRPYTHNLYDSPPPHAGEGVGGGGRASLRNVGIDKPACFAPHKRYDLRLTLRRL